MSRFLIARSAAKLYKYGKAVSEGRSALLDPARCGSRTPDSDVGVFDKRPNHESISLGESIYFVMPTATFKCIRRSVHLIISARQP
jgi:hypothetical protein